MAVSKFTAIRRAINTLKNCYPEQEITKETIILFLNNRHLYDTYINY